MNEKTKDKAPSIFARIFIPIIAAVLIDGISEFLKWAANTFFHQFSESYHTWDERFGLAMLTITAIAILCGVMIKFAKFESHNPGPRIAILTFTLILIGSSNLWEVVLDRSPMLEMYDRMAKDSSSFSDLNKISLAKWNRSLYFHGESPGPICGEDNCSFAVVYTVPKIFGEEEISFEFKKDEKLLSKDRF